MDLIQNFIFEQLSSKKISREKAKQMLLQLMNYKNNSYLHDIAIIGVGMKVGVANNKYEFWRKLKSGSSLIIDFPSKRIEEQGLELSSDKYNKGGYMKEIDGFDAEFFRISPKEAKLMDPIQRLFLETAWEAIEDSGYGGNEIYGSRTGVFVGRDHTNESNYRHLSEENDPLILTGSWTSILASRISYIYNFRGPSIVIDTACSSGLVSIHMACQSLRNEECELAIAGGVNILFSPTQNNDKNMMGMIESKSGIVRTFDRRADGTLWGEGINALVLKPLKKAIEDNDNIYSIIKGSAINNDGASNGLTAPNAEAQEDVILRAWKDANINPDKISYVEAHGTGTKLGDPIEINALTNAFNKFTKRKQFCGIGSVKTNIGHLVGASGTTSLIKVILALKNKKIPPIINFTEINPYINFCNSPFYVNNTLSEWDKGEYPRIAAINCFGLSGTNCHIVLQEAPENIDSNTDNNNEYRIMTISGKSKSSLKAIIKKYYDFFVERRDINFTDVCYTTNIGRGHYNYRLAIIAKTIEDLIKVLKNILDVGKDKNAYYGENNSSNNMAYLAKSEVKVKDLEKKLSSAAEEKVRESIKSNNENMDLITEICKLYVEGANIDWKLFYNTKKAKRISLPTYAFTHKRYWIDSKSIKKSNGIKLHNCESVKNFDTNKLKIIGLDKVNDNGLYKKIAEIWMDALELSQVDIYRSFYELGGDSIIAYNIIGRVNKSLDIDVNVASLFRNSSIYEFSKYLENNFKVKSKKNKLSVIKHVEDKSIYKVSSSQKGLLILNQFYNMNISYNIPIILKILGDIKIDKIEEVFRKLINRHESLRTSFDFQQGEYVQVIHKNVDFSVEVIKANTSNIKNIIKRVICEFDLSQAPLFRVSMIELNTKEHIMVMDLHHIIADDTSCNIIINEFIKLYEGKSIPQLNLQYRDYSEWYNKLLSDGYFKNQEKYWIDNLSGDLPILNLPTDYPRPQKQSFEGNIVKGKIEMNLTEKIKKFSKENNYTLYIVLLAAYNILLYKYTSQEDIIVGSPTLGRNCEEVSGLVGMFVNTLILRNYPKSSKRIIDFIDEVKDNTLNSITNQDYSFNEIVNKLDIKRELNKNPIFDVMFVLQTFDAKGFDLGDLRFEPYEIEENISKFDLTLSAVENSECIKVKFRYNTKIFKKETIKRMYKHFITILDAITENPQTKLADIYILDEMEEKELISFNSTYEEYDKNKSIYHLFKAEAEKHPNNIAVTCGDDKFSYAELNRQIDNLSSYLKDIAKVQIGDFIGIRMMPTQKLIVAMLAVIKIGAIYVPIDREFPQKRVNFIIKDGKINLLLTDKITNNSGIEVESLIIDEIITKREENYKYAEEILQNNSPIYVIYTSGTTGKPKGVAIKNQSLVNYVLWFSRKFNISNHDKAVLLSSYAFDLGYTVIYSSIINGSELHLVSKDIYSEAEKVLAYIYLYKITYIKITPSMFNMIINSHLFFQKRYLESLRLIVLGGEMISSNDVKKFKETYPKVNIVNHYGPTESTIGAIFHSIDFTKFNEFEKNPVIGKPINNTKVLILDRNLLPAPIGVYGEIHLSGDGLALGYINNDSLNKDKFITSKLLKKKFGVDVLYKTGDIGKYLDNGDIKLLGRSDSQVKIRGYRVDLQEVRNAILTYIGIKEVLVLSGMDEDNVAFLYAYFIAEKEVKISDLRNFLMATLPLYMIPSYFIQVKNIKLNANGKVDKSMLPDPLESLKVSQEYESPKNEIEKRLLEIWKDVLRTDKIGVCDDFFGYGGQSLKANTLFSRVYKEFNISIPLRQIFETPTVRGLAEYITNCNKFIYTHINLQPQKPYYPLSSAQKRIFIINEIMDTGISYNMPMVMSVNGNFKFKRAQEAMDELVNRHEMLRTSFEFKNGEPVQIVNNDLQFCLVYKEIKESEIDNEINKFIKPFKLNKAPLIRAGFLKVEENRSIFIIDMHHIVADGISRKIIQNEFFEIYEKKQLPQLSVQYKDFAVWQNSMLKSEQIQKQEQYWIDIFKNELVPLKLPLDYPRSTFQNFIGDRVTVEVDELICSQIRKFASDTNTSLFVVLLAMFNILISKYSNQDDIVIGTPVAGREHPEINNVVGMFVNMLPIRSYLDDKQSFMDFFNGIKNNVKNALMSQDYQFEMLVEKLNKKRDFSRNPIFDVCFVISNKDNNEMKISDKFNVHFHEYGLKVSKFDILLHAMEIDNGLRFSFEYSTSLFKKDTIERMAKNYVEIIKQILANSDICIKDIQIFYNYMAAQIFDVDDGDFKL
ncbi:non-ribosomal peptide synthetase [Clostridium felsineum]|uniref:non-ribosomal peptide synthetase n=1 Tax=Clostridium felsineum TaxID=36839 RepID=UPI00098CA276|nr:non-ribosomal peptide synthetase [Clostridium felsineum]URZ17238.1 D-alanine--D-alanyl carrier protein ligase [Clostridium felsineum DSM 794]